MIHPLRPAVETAPTIAKRRPEPVEGAPRRRLETKPTQASF